MLTLLTLSAQVSFEERIEFEQKDGFIGERFYQMGEYGVLVRSVSEKTDQGMDQWKYELFNTDLVSVWTELVPVSAKLSLDEEYTTDESIHSLFKDRKGNYQLVTVNVADKELTEIEGEVLNKTYITEMKVLGEYAYCEAYIKKEPFLFSVNCMTSKQRLIPISLEGIKTKKLSIKSIQVLEESNEVFVYLNVAVSKKQREVYVVRLDDQGKKKSQYHLTQDIDKNLTSLSARSVGGGNYIFTGTYSDKGISTSQGLFFCKAYNGELDFIEFYNFTDLDNFLTYLPERKQKKLEKKKKRKNKKGKEFKIDYRIAEHEIQVLDDGYLVLGEAYYPTYRTETYTAYVNGNPVMRTRRVFDGYQYTHAVLAKFDNDGKMEWDQTFEMFPASKPFYVKRFIATPENIEDAITMVFASGTRITSKTVNFDGVVVEDKESEQMELENESAEIKWSNSNLSYWYDDYFLAYGFQKIKDKKADKRKDKRRKVYFMTKIKY